MASVKEMDYDWVELLDPKSKQTMYVNLKSAECLWERPVNARIKSRSPSQWWELFDVSGQRNYYYNSHTGDTVWQRPPNGEIIPLTKVQLLQQTGQTPSLTPTSNPDVFRHMDPHYSDGGRHVQHRKFPTSVLETPPHRIPESTTETGHPRFPQNGDQALESVNIQRRVRDWLCESSVSRNMAGSVDPFARQTDGGKAVKGPACLSDKPVRRIQPFFINPESPIGSSQPSASLGSCELNSTTSNFNGASASGRPEITTNSSIPSQPFNIAGLSKTSTPRRIEPIAHTTTHPDVPKSHSLVKSKLHSNVVNYALNVPTTTPTPVLPLHNHSSYPAAAAAPCGMDTMSNRQRAFPRTNPSISRPSTTSGWPTSKSQASSVATLDRHFPSHSSVIITELPNITHPSSTVLQPTNHESTSKLTTTVPNSSSFDHSQRSAVYPISDQATVFTSSNSHSSLKLNFDSPETKDVSSSNPSGGGSVSPEPSSSSSRESSVTALSVTSSEVDEDDYADNDDDEDLKPDLNLTSGKPNHAQILCDNTSSAHPVSESHARSNELLLGASLLESEQPPIPPPRSASTMSSQRYNPVSCFSYRFYQPMNMDGMNLHTANPTQVFTDPGFFYAIPYPCPYPTPYIVPRGFPMEHLVPNSLSRNDPMRANVIQPHHRRYASQSRFLVGPVNKSGNILYSNNSGIVYPSVPPDLTNCPSSVENAQHATYPISSVGSHAGNTYGSSIYPAGTSSPSTMTTWTSRSTNTNWDMRTDDVSQQQQPSVRPMKDGEGGINNTNLIHPDKIILPLVRRTASGGFLGPADDSIMDKDFAHFLQNGHQQQPPSVGPPLFSMVYPGHPQFPNFIARFNWPKELFKSEHDATNVMMWTKAKFSKCLLATTEANLKKEVADTFKIIQSYMGDRKARLSSPDYASIIIQRAMNRPGLRDELFAQLCKQTTCNADIKSLSNGWAMLCVCLYYFPPNNKFRDPLKEYLNFRASAAVVQVMSNGTRTVHPQHRSQDSSSLNTAAAIAAGLAPFDAESVNHVRMPAATSSVDGLDSLADQLSNCSLPQSTAYLYPETADRLSAAHFARVAPRLFLRSLNIGCRKFAAPPSVQELCDVKEFILKPCIFGSSLEEIMQIQMFRFPHLKLPWIQLFLTEEILRLGGAKSEGIFRLSPDLDLLIEIRCQLEKLFEISLETGDEDEEIDDSFNCSPTPTLSESIPLAGEYVWPILPLPLDVPTSDYVLLKPITRWPQNLFTMAKRSEVGSSDYQVDAHLAAGLLKLWLRELANPLIPASLQPTCLQAACDAEAYERQTPTQQADEENKDTPNPIRACCQLVRKIPALERRSLLHFILLLQHLAKSEHSSVSLMNPRNLATVIAPNLLRTTDAREMLENIRPQTLFARLLITYLDVAEEVEHLLNETSPTVESSLDAVESFKSQLLQHSLDYCQ